MSLIDDRAATSLNELLEVVEAVTASEPAGAEAAVHRHLTGVVGALRTSAVEGAAQ